MPGSDRHGEVGSRYDRIGANYALHRRADPRIETAIHDALGGARHVLNVGAGSGSYEPADRCLLAVEPSVAMMRQRPVGAAPCLQGSVESLPFSDEAFDAALAVLTIHHWTEPRLGLLELSRVANGLVLFHFDPPIHNAFWLFADYIPAAATLATTAAALAVDEVADLVDADRVEEVLIPHDCLDGFGWAYWRRPEAYLDPAVRQCISALCLAPAADVHAGLARLRADIDSGRWQERYGELLDVDAIDGGFRLIVRDAA